MRWVFGILGGLVALVAVGIATVIALFNPNDYKGLMVDQAAQAGWDLSIDGDMSLSFWPSVAIDLPPTRLANKTAQQSVSVDKAAVSIAVWPLISSQRVEASTLTLIAPVIQWDLDAAESAKGASGAASADTQPGTDLAGFAIGGLDVQNAKVSLYQGGQLAHDIDISRLTLGALAPDTWVPVDATLSYQAPGMAPIAHQLSADLMTNTALDRIQLRGLDSTTAGVQLRGDLSITPTPLAIGGELTISEFNPQRVLAGLGVALPPMNNPDALTRASLRMTFDEQRPAYARELSIAFDDTLFTGEGGLTSVAPLQFNIDVTGNQLNVDDYLAPSTSAEAQSTDPAANPAAPLAALAGIDGQLTLGLEQLRASGLVLTDIDALAVIKDRRIDLQRLNANGYDGAIAAKAVVNGRSSVPSMSAEVGLTGLQIQGLLVDVADFGDLSGIANLTGTFTAEGADANRIMASLNGTTQGQLTNGALRGLAIDSLVCEGIATLVGGQSKLAGGDTAFDAMSFNSNIVNGVATLNTLKVGLANLQLAGTGQINLPAQSMDMKLGANLAGDSAITGCKVPSALANATIPVACKGGFGDDPLSLCKLDSSGMDQLLSASAKAKAQEKIDEQKAALKTKVETKKEALKEDAKAKLEEKLGSKLKGLFN